MKHELRRIYLHIWSELQLRGLQVAALCALSALGEPAHVASCLSSVRVFQRSCFTYIILAHADEGTHSYDMLFQRP